MIDRLLAEPARIARLAERLARHGLATLEVRQGAARLRIVASDAATGAPAVSAPSITATAPAPGRLAWCHPATRDAPLEVGAAVSAGAIVAYLVAGELVLPVTAPADGTITARLGEDGALVGFGTPILALAPTGEGDGPAP
jgi:acetyl-CoA carboxylase biotin carboxyl carrier protein